MLDYAKHFLDIVLVDSTYKRNRFNLTIVNIIGISNYGKNLMLGFGLLSNEKKESHSWLFSNLKKAWRQEPLNFVTDECESMIYGIKQNFNSKNILCGWHIQKKIFLS